MMQIACAKALGMALILGALAACAQAAPPQHLPTIWLTARAPSALLALPHAHHGKIILEVGKPINPQQFPVALVVHIPGRTLPQTFALYPPDKSARIALRVPADASSIRIELAGRPDERATGVTVRALAFTDIARRQTRPFA